jgi:preprotein translocase subunit SecD
MQPAAIFLFAGLIALGSAQAPAQPAPEGSTILIFKMERIPGKEAVAKVDLEQLAGNLQKRLDPNKLYQVIVRISGKDQVEIILPPSFMKKDGEVQRVKALVPKVGNLEFAILANENDDKAAIEDAARQVADPERKKDLEQAQQKGLPPPGPFVPGKAEPKQFTIKLHGNDCIVAYSWVELGPHERLTLGLNNDAEKDDKRNAAWLAMAKAREKGLAVQLPPPEPGTVGKLLQGALFYSRVCQDQNLSNEVRQKKKYDYFVLARNPEIDPATGKEVPRLDGSYLVVAASQSDAAGRPAVSFTFNAAGGKLLSQLSKKNLPSGEGASTVKRHLAIILDGLVMSAPTIKSEISTHGQISGNFTQAEVDELVSILRAGALTPGVRFMFVSETVVGPKKQ